MYTKQELKRANELLLEVTDVLEATDPSAHGLFTLCAFEKKIRVFPATERPKGSILIVRISKAEMLGGMGARKWDSVHRILRAFVAEKVLE